VKNIYNYLDELTKIVAKGVDDRSAYANTVRALDTRVIAVLNQLHCVPNEKVSLFRETDEERLNIAKRDLESSMQSPIGTIPYGVTKICNAIYRDVDEDLMAFATDFEFTQILTFTISFAGFGPSMGNSSPSEQERDQRRLRQMLDRGYVIRKKRNNYVVSFCDSNTKLLKEYCKQKFGAKTLEFLTHDDHIRNVKVYAKLGAYQCSEPQNKEVKQMDSKLSADELHELVRICNSCKGAVANYMEMVKIGSGNLVLNLIESYQYEIEQITGTHGTVWTNKEREYAGPRVINRKIHEIQDEIGNKAVEVLQRDGKTFVNLFQSKLAALVKPLGFFLDKFCIGEHNFMEITLIQNSLCTDDCILDAKIDRRNLSVYVRDTKENIAGITSHIQSVLTSSEVARYEVGIRDGLRYISRLTIVFHKASDLVALVEKVSDEEQT